MKYKEILLERLAAFTDKEVLTSIAQILFRLRSVLQVKQVTYDTDGKESGYGNFSQPQALQFTNVLAPHIIQKALDVRPGDMMDLHGLLDRVFEEMKPAHLKEGYVEPQHIAPDLSDPASLEGQLKYIKGAIDELKGRADEIAKKISGKKKPEKPAETTKKEETDSPDISE